MQFIGILVATAALVSAAATELSTTPVMGAPTVTVTDKPAETGSGHHKHHGTKHDGNSHNEVIVTESTFVTVAASPDSSAMPSSDCLTPSSSSSVAVVVVTTSTTVLLSGNVTEMVTGSNSATSTWFSSDNAPAPLLTTTTIPLPHNASTSVVCVVGGATSSCSNLPETSVASAAMGSGSSNTTGSWTPFLPTIPKSTQNQPTNVPGMPSSSTAVPLSSGQIGNFGETAKAKATMAVAALAACFGLVLFL